MKNIKTLVTTALFALSLGSVQAVSVFVAPASQTVNVADTATIEIRISGLGNLSSLSLGAWAADLQYDSSIISLNSISFGTQLDTGTFGSIQIDNGSGGGLISIDEVSLESPADLNANQPGAFVLATIDFTALATGVSPVSFVHDGVVSSFGDEMGVELADIDFGDGEIRVGDGTSIPSVPDGGSTALLLGLVLVGLAGIRKGLRAQNS